jgi:hypothetical protein
MNMRNIVILILVAIVIIGAIYYLGNQETTAPETPVTTTPSLEPVTPSANTQDEAPDPTPDTQPTTGEPGQQ